ncbi:MAG: preprotein translocase subunit SecG [Betaproteobacteria bacterium]|nr:preprotein translocase subunit SecG [Betaproteobacteria bacterium]
MKELLLVVHMIAAVGLVGLVLLQQGKGADMGAAFGSGASQSLFGSRGSATFLSRLTAGFATVFFLTSLSLTVVYSGKTQDSVLEQAPVPVQPVEQVPAVPVAPPTGAPEVPK